MNEKPVVVEGIVKPDGTLEIEGKIPLPAGKVRVTVEGLLLNPEDHPFFQMLERIWATHDQADPRLRTPEEMEAEYRQVWADLSDGSLELVNYMHRTSLAGGNYMWNRFQKGRAYKPYLMTDAGSVFLLRVKEAVPAKAFLQQARDFGLPLSKAVSGFYGLQDRARHELWQYCPFLPENGFGEIALDLHTVWKELTF